MSNIMGHLRYVAGYRADDRRVAEFGPAGGNPDANAKDHIEWRAADEIERLRAELDTLHYTLKTLRDDTLDIMEGSGDDVALMWLHYNIGKLLGIEEEDE